MCIASIMIAIRGKVWKSACDWSRRRAPVKFRLANARLGSRRTCLLIVSGGHRAFCCSSQRAPSRLLWFNTTHDVDDVDEHRAPLSLTLFLFLLSPSLSAAHGHLRGQSPFTATPLASSSSTWTVPTHDESPQCETSPTPASTLIRVRILRCDPIHRRPRFLTALSHLSTRISSLA